MSAQIRVDAAPVTIRLEMSLRDLWILEGALLFAHQASGGENAAILKSLYEQLSVIRGRP